MADMLQFDLVSPERKLASGKARAVQIPGADGDLTAMPDHTPTITTLRPGVLVVEGATGEERFVVTGGFAEISPEATTVLAERAFPAAGAEARTSLASHSGRDAHQGRCGIGCGKRRVGQDRR